MKEIITRPEARNLGLNKYFTGKPCPRGHIADRYTQKGSCTECLSEDVSKKVKSGYYSKRYNYKRDEILSKQKQRYRGDYSLGKRNAEACAKWARENKEKVRHIKQAYKHRRRCVEREGSSTADIEKWVISQRKVCYWCGVDCKKNYHIDHYNPLSKGGRHEIENMVIACPPCNLRKSAKDPYEFAAESGRLF